MTGADLTFDVVVVGGGHAGCEAAAAAARAAANLFICSLMNRATFLYGAQNAWRRLIDCKWLSIFSFRLAHNSLLIQLPDSELPASSDSAEKSTALTMSAMVIFSALRARE